ADSRCCAMIDLICPRCASLRFSWRKNSSSPSRSPCRWPPNPPGSPGLEALALRKPIAPTVTRATTASETAQILRLIVPTPFLMLFLEALRALPGPILGNPLAALARRSAPKTAPSAPRLPGWVNAALHPLGRDRREPG